MAAAPRTTWFDQFDSRHGSGAVFVVWLLLIAGLVVATFGTTHICFVRLERLALSRVMGPDAYAQGFRVNKQGEVIRHSDGDRRGTGSSQGHLPGRWEALLFGGSYCGGAVVFVVYGLTLSRLGVIRSQQKSR